uniref:Ig-like domain-containing protein n=1 Tax=Varanus komodoensis TaxID=61221 RepID=A0A8D2KQZ5_VARKO
AQVSGGPPGQPRTAVQAQLQPALTRDREAAVAVGPGQELSTSSGSRRWSGSREGGMRRHSGYPSLPHSKHEGLHVLGQPHALRGRRKRLHTWQMMAGCEVGLDRPRGRYLRFGYDGSTYLSLEVETLTWTLPTVDGGTPSLDLWGSRKSKLLKLSLWARCPLGGFLGAQERPPPCQALERFCVHPRDALSAEPPKVTVAGRAGQDDTETLICRDHGFYPREIDMAWTRDGEVWLQDASHGVLAPNSDGTFYAWLSVRLDPWDRECFLCRVEHDALQTPVELAWEEPEALRGAYGPASGECVPLLLGLSKAGQAPLGCKRGPGRIR